MANNTERLGYNYRGKAWNDGQPITTVTMPDGTLAEAVVAASYLWNGIAFVKGPTVVKTARVTVTTAGTRVVLAATVGIISLTIKALAANTGLIYVGDSTVAASNGFQLSPGDSISLDFQDPSTIYLDSAVNGEGVTYLAVS